MGKLFFNEKTGEFFEASIRKRKPPNEDFVEIKQIDRRHHPTATYYSAYCKDCGKYHYEYHDWSPMPLYKRMYLKYVKKYGCKVAKKVWNVTIENCRIEFYEFIEKLIEHSLFDLFYSYLNQYDNLLRKDKHLRRKVYRLFRKALEDKKALEKLESFIVAEVI